MEKPVPTPEAQKIVNEYFKRVCDAYSLGNIETSYNAPISTLIKQFGCEARDLSGGRSGAAGENVDILLWREGENTSETEPFAGIEVKKINGIDDRARQQIVVETKRYGNVILTDNLTWHFWSLDGGEPKRYSAVQLIEQADGKLRLNKPSIELFASLISDFLLKDPAQIRSSAKLAEYMAIHARTIRSVITGLLKDDGHGQPIIDEQQRTKPLFVELYSLYSKIKQDLRPLLDTESFADMYAQTVVYGLFIARYNDTAPEAFNRYEAIGNLRQESNLLKLFFAHIATSTNQHPTLDAVIDKLCELYRIADVEALLDQDEEKDTIIHFYEEFLQGYDPALRKSLGVFYTPYQVVRWMVRMVDKVLVDELEIEGGLSNNEAFDLELASTPYYEGKNKREKTTITRSVPRVSILDPAVGTGTFHAEIIRYIHDTYFSGSKEAFWKNYILDDHGLMSRLIGFEIMMTSYVVAHLKVRRTIDETLGDAAASATLPASNIYLTNTLAPPLTSVEDADQMSLFAVQDFSGAVTEEARKADAWKSRRPIKVIIGNPPYNRHGGNDYDTSSYKFNADGTANKRTSGILKDDYIMFFHFAEKLINKNGEGVLAFISPHAYLDAPNLAGMRASLLKTFDKLYVVDLHGNTNKGEKTPDGKTDENIFDIRQGVSIIIALKNSDSEELATVSHSELFGERDSKFRYLEEGSINFTELQLDRNNLFLKPQSTCGKVEYENGISIASLFPVNAIGMKTHNDDFASDTSKEVLAKRLESFQLMDESSARVAFNLGKDTRDWKYIYAKTDLAENFPDNGSYVQESYRPFDKRWMFYTGTTKGIMAYPVYQIMKHILHNDAHCPIGNNIGIAFSKVTFMDVPPFVSDCIVEAALFSKSAVDATSFAPLYLCPDGMETAWRLNFDERVTERLTHNLSVSPEPIQIFDYIYGILYDPIYRQKYNEFLKRDYPRVPIVSDPEAADNPDAFYVSEERFWQYVDAGSRLRKLHLLEDKHPTELTIEPNDSNDLEIGAISYKDGILHLNKKKTIKGIPEEAWNYYIGGYQVLPKWFKSHKGELLDIKNFSHIQNVVGALTETIKIQFELKMLGV